MRISFVLNFGRILEEIGGENGISICDDTDQYSDT